MRIVRCPSGSAVKLKAIKNGLVEVWPGESFEIQGLPVELQDRPDMQINAEPEGFEQTREYARARWHEMCRQHGKTPGLDISIESGVITGLDIAVVALYNTVGKEVIALSEGVAFPEGTLEEARRRGFKATTVGDIIHEKWPGIPANSWQANFRPFISREQQIQGAVVSCLRGIDLW